MSLDDPVILTCSISGAVANREQCPAIPYTPEEYAAEARRIVDEGGSMIHIHARTPDGTPSYETEDFRAITEAILAEVGDVVINYSTGAVGVPVEKRIASLRELRPDVGALVGWVLFTYLLGIGDEDKFDLGGILGSIVGVMVVLLVLRAVGGSGKGRSDRPARGPAV